MFISKRIFNFSIISVFKSLSILGYIYFSTDIDLIEFKKYALYFSFYQLISQVVLLQLPILFFRYGKNPNFKIAYAKFSLLLIITALLISVLVVVVKPSESYQVFYAIPVVILFSVGQIYSELTRGCSNESQAFVLSGLPSVAYLISLVLIYFGVIDKFFEIWLIEICFFLITPIYGFIKLFSLRKSEVNINDIKSQWKIFSRNLYINGIIWYFYFNAPVFLLKDSLSDLVFNELAKTLRIMTALSTAAALIGIVFQKDILELFINKENYILYKNKFKSHIKKVIIFLIFSPFLLFIHGEFLIYLLLGLMFILFLTIYFISNFLIAEEKTTIIPKSMIVGFFTYVSLFFFNSFILDIHSIISIITPIFIGLFVTLLIRFKITFYEQLG